MRGLHLLEDLPAMILFLERSSVIMMQDYRSKVECLYRDFFIVKFIFRQLLMEQNMSLGSWLLEPSDATWGGFRVGHGFECWSLGLW